MDMQHPPVLFDDKPDGDGCGLSGFEADSRRIFHAVVLKDIPSAKLLDQGIGGSNQFTSFLRYYGYLFNEAMVIPGGVLGYRVPEFQSYCRHRQLQFLRRVLAESFLPLLVLVHQLYLPYLLQCYNHSQV